MFCKKSGLCLTFISSILLVLGSFYNFVTDNLLSFAFSLMLPLLLVFNLVLGLYWLFKKNIFFLFSIFCIIIYFLCFDLFVQLNLFRSLHINKTLPSLNTLAILSYNTQGFKHNEVGKVDASGEIVSFINNENADVFCIQEFSAIQYKYFNNYPHFFKTNIVAGKGKSVMAIFSKHPIIDKGYINFPESRNGAMYVDVVLNKEVIRIYNIHLESYRYNDIHKLNSPKNGYLGLFKRINIVERKRNEQAIIINNHVRNFKGKVIICGDFNSTQFSSSYRIVKGDRIDSFIESGIGFGKTYDFLNYPFRLDYILVDDNFDVLSHQNFNVKLSDHEPILTKLVVN